MIYKRRGELDRAEEMHRKALAINEKLGRQEGMAGDYGNLGLIYQQRGELDRAEEMHRKSLAIEEKLGRQEGMAQRLRQPRADLRDAGRAGPGRRDAPESRWPSRRSSADQEGIATSYGNLGVIHAEAGRAGPGRRDAA